MATKIIPLSQLGSEIEKIYKNIKGDVEATQRKTTQKAAMFNLKLKKRLVPEGNTPNPYGRLKEKILKAKSGKDYSIYTNQKNLVSGFEYPAWLDNRKGVTSRGLRYPQVQRSGVSGGGFWTASDKATKDYFKNIVVEDVSKWETVK